MRKALPVIAVVAASVGLTGCGGNSTKASRDCFEAWNAVSNKPRQSEVAGRFAVARVTHWRAEASEGSDVSAGGRATEGCGYVFHTSERFVSISGEWDGNAVRWNVPPTIRGSWSPSQQAAAADNATVGSDGVLRKQRPS